MNLFTIESWVSKRYNYPDFCNAYHTLLDHISPPRLLWPLLFIKFILQQNPFPSSYFIPYHSAHESSSYQLQRREQYSGNTKIIFCTSSQRLIKIKQKCIMRWQSGLKSIVTLLHLLSPTCTPILVQWFGNYSQHLLKLKMQISKVICRKSSHNQVM